MKYILCSIVIMVMSFSIPVQAGEEGIAVIVNDNVITFSDIRDRRKLIMQSAGMPNTQEMRDRITPQITEILIEEQLKLQEAVVLEIEISEEQVQEGFAKIAGQNNIPPEQFKEMLKQSGINLNTLYEQIRAEIAWGSVVAKRIRPRVNVTDSDIDAELEMLKNQRKLQQSDQPLPTRDEVLSIIGNQRLGRQAKGYLLDLRADAFIENRV